MYLRAYVRVFTTLVCASDRSPPDDSLACVRARVRPAKALARARVLMAECLLLVGKTAAMRTGDRHLDGYCITRRPAGGRTQKCASTKGDLFNHLGVWLNKHA